MHSTRVKNSRTVSQHETWKLMPTGPSLRRLSPRHAARLLPATLVHPRARGSFFLDSS